MSKVFHFVTEDSKFLHFNAGFSERRQNLINIVDVLRDIIRVDDYDVHIDKTRLPFEFCKDHVQHTLVRSGCVFEAEGNSCVLILAGLADE